MAFSPDDLASLGQFIGNEIDKRFAAAAPPPPDRASQVGVPDVPFDAGPEFYVHLANGEVIKSYDSGSTHMPGSDGSTVQVIGRYQVGA